MIIYYILGGVKVKLIKADFNNRYLMLSANLKKIKKKNKKLDSIEIEFTIDNRTLLVLMLGLSDRYKSLIRI
jgi:hypothetical protein